MSSFLLSLWFLTLLQFGCNGGDALSFSGDGETIRLPFQPNVRIVSQSGDDQSTVLNGRIVSFSGDEEILGLQKQSNGRIASQSGDDLSMVSVGRIVSSQSGDDDALKARATVELKVSYCPNGLQCFNGAKCSQRQTGGYYCRCAIGYAGDTCQEPVPESPCYPDPCQGDCKCVESRKHEHGRYCVSESGYIGDNCSIAVPIIACRPSEIVISVLKGFYEEFDKNIGNSYIYVSSSSDGNVANQCRGRLVDDSYVVTIPLPFSACGTYALATYNDYISFTNRIWINRQIASGLFDMPVPIIDFECRYDKVYDIVTSLQPLVEPPPMQAVTRSGNFTVVSELCKIAVCDSRCPTIYTVSGGAVYTVGQMIHVGVHANLAAIFRLRTTLVTSIHGMFLSCNRDPSQPRIIDLAQNGCPTTPGFELRMSAGRNDFACLSFQLPRVSSCSEVYIHIRIRICHFDNALVCPGYPTVGQCRMISKRSAFDPIAEDDVTVIGPLYILEGQKGLRSYTIYPEDGGVRVVEEERPVVAIDASVTDVDQPVDHEESTGLVAWGFLGVGIFALLVVSVLVAVLRNAALKH
ncbi:unnamed protein product [Clavelina lepadiformis]|uniref:Transmembrane protein Vc569 n=1 Tax=Clavelina lepadiformis TaxID=159417 RepID=A0ABP0H6M4_CLALP